MKIVSINGQNHRGSSYHIGRLLAEQLACGDEIVEFFLPRDMDGYCLGCYLCVEDETRCPFWDEKKRILDAMEQAELFIFTTPNYCLAPSGAMKSFLDRLFDLWMVHRPKEWMFQKRALIVSTAAGASCRKVIGTVRDSLFYWGVPQIVTYGVAVQAMNWSQVRQEKKARIERDVSRLAKRLGRTKPPRVGLGTRALFFIMGRMHAASWDSSPVERVYWEERGWLGKARPWRK